MKYIFIILTLSLNIYANDCLNQKDEMGFKWASGPVRTQGGGWFWYLGRGFSKDFDESIEEAQSRALDRMVKECQVIPRQAKFIENCIDKVDDKYIAFARISIKDRYCNKNSLTNKVLTKQHSRFIRKIKKKNNTLSDCSKNEPDMCELEGDLLISKSRFKEGYLKYKKGCIYNDLSSCSKEEKFLRFKYAKDGEVPKAKKIQQDYIKELIKISEKLCNRGRTFKYCNQTASLKAYAKKITVEVFTKRVKDLCTKKIDTTACNSYAYSILNKKKKMEAMEIFKMGCLNGDHNSCESLLRVFSKRDYNKNHEKELRVFRKYINKGCELGSIKLCEHYKYLQYKTKELDRKSYVKHLKETCEILEKGYMPEYQDKKDILQSCIFYAEKFRENNNKPSRYLKLACIHGSKKACADEKEIKFCNLNRSLSKCTWTKLRLLNSQNNKNRKGFDESEWSDVE